MPERFVCRIIVSTQIKIMQFNCKYVSASEAGDYFQVLFEKERDVDKEYFLIQRRFEFSDRGKCYIEPQGEDYIGHYKITKSTISPERSYVKIQRWQDSDITINFNTSTKNYNEIKRVLKIMIPNIIEE